MSKYKDTTESARDIRKVLKAEYPNTKFSVRVKRFSMGSSVDINWTDGPLETEVADITAHLKGGDYLNEHIMPCRRISRMVMEAAARACAKHYNIAVPEVKGEDFPYLTDLTLVDSGLPICDKVHWAAWSTSVYDVELEKAFAEAFPNLEQ